MLVKVSKIQVNEWMLEESTMSAKEGRAGDKRKKEIGELVGVYVVWLMCEFRGTTNAESVLAIH